MSLLKSLLLATVAGNSVLPAVCSEGADDPPRRPTPAETRILTDDTPSSEFTAAPPWWFADGRLSFEHDAHGVTRVHYFSPTVADNNPVLFYQRLWEGFRILVRVNDSFYTADLRRAHITPWSVSAPIATPAGTFSYRAMAVKDALLFEVKAPPGSKTPTTARFTFHEHFLTLCEDSTDFRMSSHGFRRALVPFIFDPNSNRLLGGMVEQAARPHLIGLSIAFDKGAGYRRFSQNIKHQVERALGPAQPFRAVLRVHTRASSDGAPAPPGPAQLRAFLETSAQADRDFLEAFTANVHNQEERYSSLAQQLPRVEGVDPLLARFFATAPLYHESCRATAIQGALRASNVHYWIWGWDGMTDNAATAAWGQGGFLGEMLDLYRSHSNANGISQCFGFDMSILSNGPLPAQMMYLCLLQQYYDATGDVEGVRHNFPFARSIYDRVRREALTPDASFVKGSSLFPDFPALMHETGNDFSLINNLFWYCGVRAADRLASLVGDEAISAMARRDAEAIEQRFCDTFIAPNHGFPVSSVDATTLERRNSFMLSGVKWETDAALDLLEPQLPRMLAFTERNLMGRGGLRETPLWGDVFDADGNQLHCWWPVMSDFFVHAANECGRADLLEKFCTYITRWVPHLTCPEGIPFHVETDQLEMDRWNALKGAWQSYSVRGWYQSVLNGVLGVRADAGGITIAPGIESEWTVRAFHHLGRRFDIVKTGKGRNVARLAIDGQFVEGTCKTPSELLRRALERGDPGRTIRIEARCAGKPQALSLREAFGSGVEQVARQKGRLTFQLQGAGTARVRLRCARKPTVRLDGLDASVCFYPQLRTAVFETHPIPGKPIRIEVFP
jgi:hypothetical protein